MVRLNRQDCRLDPAEPGTYYVEPPHLDVYTAVVRRFRANPYLRRWGVRPYGKPEAEWTFRSSMEEVIRIGLTYPAPDVPRETKEAGA